MIEAAGNPVDRDSLQRQIERGLAALGLALQPDAVSRLLDYLALLLRWNGTYNLTAVREPAQMVTRHLLDSLGVLPFVQGVTLADLGTGAGLPGVPLAVARPDLRVTLVDSNGKKARFLREVVRALPLANARVAQLRVRDLQGSFDCVTARAFASLGDMLAWAGHVLAPAGTWLALKGRIDPEELAGIPAGFRLHAIHRLEIPDAAAERHLLEIRRA
ncbi:MAG: 16S rRNA (guanine(527)-N(7))-methyltransferase RsmG [Proteobacteria bacterium]|nr:16S rRNA (guanine(527)-N(7))-methyltransferase RsmG [Pseudomonadota bacterium]